MLTYVAKEFYNILLANSDEWGSFQYHQILVLLCCKAPVLKVFLFFTEKFIFYCFTVNASQPSFESTKNVSQKPNGQDFK